MRQLSFYMNAFIEAYAKGSCTWLYSNGQNIIVCIWVEIYKLSGEELALEVIKHLCQKHKLLIKK